MRKESKTMKKKYAAMKHPEKTKNTVACELIDACMENFYEIHDAAENLLDAIIAIPEKELQKLSNSTETKEQEFYQLIGMYYNAMNDQMRRNKALLSIESLDEINFAEEEDRIRQRLELVGWLGSSDKMKRRFIKRFEMKDFIIFSYILDALDLYRMGMNYLEMLKKERPDNCTIPSDRYIDYIDSALQEIQEPLKDVFEELIE